MSLIYEAPVYIEISGDIEALKRYIGGMDTFKNQKGHIGMAFDLLINVLWTMYGHTNYSTLVKRSSNVTESKIFSDTVIKIIDKFKWSTTTAKIVFGCLKNIMKETAICTSFISKIVSYKIDIRDKYDVKNMIPSMYKKLPPESRQLQTLDSWVKKIARHSKNKSPISIKQIIYFICKEILPIINVDLELYTEECIINISFDIVNKIVGPCVRKISWFKLFATHLVKCNGLDETLFDSSRYVANDESKFKLVKDDNSDTHRISVDELEKLQKASLTTNGVRDQLIFMLLITSGLRVGGLVNILLNDVCTINGTDLNINSCGKTIEKCNKWFSFSFTPHVKFLLHEWISKERASTNSLYLFPGRGGHSGHMTTGTIRNILNKLKKISGCTGTHIHVHSIRHSFAHILLENGNSIEIVSKLMGHSNVSTTQSYYLKENAVEVANRANIPWLGKKEIVKITPSFLLPPDVKSQSSNKIDRKRRSNASRLMAFTSTRLEKIDEIK